MPSNLNVAPFLRNSRAISSALSESGSPLSNGSWAISSHSPSMAA